jgi:hypothetical protein
MKISVLWVGLLFNLILSATAMSDEFTSHLVACETLHENETVSQVINRLNDRIAINTESELKLLQEGDRKIILGMTRDYVVDTGIWVRKSTVSAPSVMRVHGQPPTICATINSDIKPQAYIKQEENKSSAREQQVERERKAQEKQQKELEKANRKAASQRAKDQRRIQNLPLTGGYILADD